MRQLTYSDMARIMIVLLLGVIITLHATGCATAYKPTQQYEVGAFTIVLADADYIQDMYVARSGYTERVLGFFDTRTREMFVPFGSEDDFGKLMPNFAVLGHEVFHLPELGGNFHK